MLSYIARAQIGDATVHLLKTVAVPPPPEVEEEPLAVERCTEFDAPLDLTKLSLGTGVGTEGMSVVPTDLDVIILPPRGSVREIDVTNAFGIESTGMAYCQFESDFDWLRQTHPAFAQWAKKNSISGCEKALLLPAHSIILKSGSPVIMRALEAQEIKRRREEIELVRTIQDTEEYITKRKMSSYTDVTIIIFYDFAYHFI